MRFIRIFQYVAMILLISTLVVKTASAEERSLQLTLDGGFVGRPVSLAVFDDAVRVSWDASVLVRPTGMGLSVEEDGSVTILIDDEASFVSGSIVRVGLRSSVMTAPVFRVTVAGGLTESYPALIEEGGWIVADLPVSGVMHILALSDPQAIAVATTDQSAGSGNVTLTDQKIVLTLDSGFVARPVSLELFDGDVTVAWDEKALVKPTVLTVVSARGGVWQDQVASAHAVRLEFEDPTSVSQNGIFSISHRALRPPTTVERPDVNVIGSTTSTQSATFKGTSILYSHQASSMIAFAPVYCSGIMRTGTASWYKYKNCLCAASPDVPKGTQLKVSRQDDPSRSVIVTVNDYGPDRSLFPERVIDLDYPAFSAIGNPRGGVLDVTVEQVE